MCSPLCRGRSKCNQHQEQPSDPVRKCHCCTSHGCFVYGRVDGYGKLQWSLRCACVATICFVYDRVQFGCIVKCSQICVVMSGHKRTGKMVAHGRPSHLILALMSLFMATGNTKQRSVYLKWNKCKAGYAAHSTSARSTFWHAECNSCTVTYLACRVQLEPEKITHVVCVPRLGQWQKNRERGIDVRNVTLVEIGEWK